MSAKNEMMALVGACVQEFGDNFLVPEFLNQEFEKILTKKFNIYNEDKLEKYDLIIEEKPSDVLKIFDKLTEKGIYITTPNSFEDRDLFANLSKLYWIVMPYFYLDENLNAKPLVFASKKPHPTADIIRHRSDFVENTTYYTTDIHIASFTLPKFMFEKIKDVIKV
jgi:spermidine synthase